MWRGGRRALRFAQGRNMMTNTFAQSQQFSARRMAGGAFYSSMPTVFGEAPTNGLPFAEYDLIFDNNFIKNVQIGPQNSRLERFFMKFL